MDGEHASQNVEKSTDQSNAPEWAPEDDFVDAPSFHQRPNFAQRRSSGAPASLTQEQVLYLQRTIGNQAVQRVLRNQSQMAAPDQGAQRTSGSARATAPAARAAILPRLPRRSDPDKTVQRVGLFDKRGTAKTSNNTTSPPVEGEDESTSAPFLYVDLAVKTGSKARGSLSLKEALGGVSGHSWFEVQLGPRYTDMDAMEADPEAKDVVQAMDPITQTLIQQSSNRTTSIGFYPAVDHFKLSNVLRQIYTSLPGQATQPEGPHFAGHGLGLKRYAITTARQAQGLFGFVKQNWNHGYHFLTYNCTHWALAALKAAGFAPPENVKEMGLFISPNMLYRRIYEILETGDSSAKVSDLKHGEGKGGRKYDTKHLSKKDQAKLDAKKKKMATQPTKGGLTARPDVEKSTLIPLLFPANTHLHYNIHSPESPFFQDYQTTAETTVNALVYQAFVDRHQQAMVTLTHDTNFIWHVAKMQKPVTLKAGHSMFLSATTVDLFGMRPPQPVTVSSPVSAPPVDNEVVPYSNDQVGQPAPEGEEVEPYQNTNGGQSLPVTVGQTVGQTIDEREPEEGQEPLKYDMVLKMGYAFKWEELSEEEMAELRNKDPQSNTPLGYESVARIKMTGIEKNLKERKTTPEEAEQLRQALDIDPSLLHMYKVKRLTTDEERQQYEVTGGGDQLMHGMPPQRFNTYDDSMKYHSMFLGANAAIFVMDSDGHLYAGGHKAGRFHHSSFLQGSFIDKVGKRNVAGAGEMKVKDGKLDTISNKSGHYMPNEWHMVQILHELGNRNVSLDGVDLRLFYREPTFNQQVTIEYPGGASGFMKDYLSKQGVFEHQPAKRIGSITQQSPQPLQQGTIRSYSTPTEDDDKEEPPSYGTVDSPEPPSYGNERPVQVQGYGTLKQVNDEEEPLPYSTEDMPEPASYGTERPVLVQENESQKDDEVKPYD